MEFYRGPNGEYGVTDASGKFREVSEQDYQQLQKGPIGSMAGAAGDFLQDEAGFLIENLGPRSLSAPGRKPFWTERFGRHLQESNDERQAARRAANPITTDVGNVAGFGASLVIPGGPADVATAPLRGAAAATRRAPASMSERILDNIATNTQDAAEASRRVPTGRERGGIGADVTASPEFGSSRPILRGMLSPEELDELATDLSTGPLTTRGDRAALRARTSDELSKADTTRQAEELYRSDVIADRIAGRGHSINAIRDNAEEATTRLVAAELGNPNAGRLTMEVLREERKAVSSTFNQAMEDAGDLRFAEDDLLSLDEAVTRAGADDERLVKGYVDDIKADASRSKSVDEAGEVTSALPTSRATQYRNRITKDIERAQNAGRMDRVASLSEVQEVLDDIIERQAVQLDPGVSEALADARYKWRILKTLDRSSTVDAGGKVNLRSFLNAYQARGNRAGKASTRHSQGAAFLRKLETLSYLTQRVEPSSGTAQRLMAKTSLGTGGLAGAAGVSQVFGD